MFNVTGGEIIIIVIVALVVLGPDRIPEVARGAGRMINKVKSFTEGMQSSVGGVMDDPSMKPLKDLTELAARPRQKLAEYALEAEAEERARKEAAKQAADEPVEPVDDAATTDAATTDETTGGTTKPAPTDDAATTDDTATTDATTADAATPSATETKPAAGTTSEVEADS